MTVEYIINNYQLGAKLRTTPTHKISQQIRIDSGHTKVIYAILTENEKAFIDKVFAQKGEIK